MTARQRVLKAIYPLFAGYNRIFGKSNKILFNHKMVSPIQSVYDLSVELNDGSILNFNTLQGKKILLVNTASDCGYTGQYADLQKLHEQYKDKLVIVAFPANDFKQQEKGTDEEIAAFCKDNFAIDFLLAKKSSVVKPSTQLSSKQTKQNHIFKWLTDKNKNGWCEQQPTWNFSKYLVNEHGVLTHYFDPAISPLSKEMIKAIEHDVQ